MNCYFSRLGDVEVLQTDYFSVFFVYLLYLQALCVLEKSRQ